MNNKIKEDIKDVIHFVENTQNLIYTQVQSKLESIVTKASENVMYNMDGEPVYQKLYNATSKYGQRGDAKLLIKDLKNCL